MKREPEKLAAHLTRLAMRAQVQESAPATLYGLPIIFEDGHQPTWGEVLERCNLQNREPNPEHN